MKNLRRFEKLAKAHGLKVVYTTSDNSGYPRNESVGLIGFKSFEQMVEFAKAHRLDECLFWQKYGWEYWCTSSSVVDKEKLSIYRRPGHANKDCFIYTKNQADDLEDSLNYELETGALVEEDDKGYINHTRKIIEELRRIEDGQVLISDCNGDIEIEWEYAIEWDYDSTRFTIGVQA